MKKCSICKKIKSEVEFDINRSTSDGFQSYCKSCRILRNRKISAEKRRDYKQNHINKIGREEFNRRARVEHQKNKAKYFARCKLRDSIKSGKIVKPEGCEICGDIPVEGHHEDYEKWDDVQWLCVKHHKEIHRKYNIVGKLKLLPNYYQLN